MKFALAGSVIALAAVASAQLDAIPSCALSCFIGPLGSDGCSALTDFKCHCQKGSELIAKVQPCVQGACSASDQQATLAAVGKTCADAGVPIQLPSAPGASSAAAPAQSSAAAPAQSSAAAPASSAPAAASSAAASAASSAGYAASSLVSKASSAVASATSGVASGTGSLPKPTPSVSMFTGGAPQATKAAALVGAAAIAMLAL